MSKLLEAIAAFQADPPNLPKTATNPHFESKYVPLKTLVREVTPKLAEHGLIWLTEPCIEEGQPALRYTLSTADGEEAREGVMFLLPAKNDPQAHGSSITYTRRYALETVLGLVGEDDDDGNAGSVRQGTSTEYTPTIPLDRARAILEKAKTCGHAEGSKLSPTLQAKLVDVGVQTGKLGHLSVDQAEDIEKWLKGEAERA